MYFVEKTKGVNYLKHFDYILFISVLMLSAIGLIVLNSATRTISGGRSMMIVQIISLVIGIIASLIISALDYKTFKTMGCFL